MTHTDVAAMAAPVSAQIFRLRPWKLELPGLRSQAGAWERVQLSFNSSGSVTTLQ